MTVVMKLQISGSRGDMPWPAPGQELDAGADEERQLVNMGVAEWAPEKEKSVQEPKGVWPPPEERAVVPEVAEVRTEKPEPKPAPEESLETIAPRRGPGRPRKDSLPQ